ncbi:hypothetical protein C3F09_12165 [candidate division GN15 bacterium]|uniref:Peptidase S26 domain-containing protein n=1 Tax=candidate division GN15 bacterium TaxID=2072418 RepID=A0A855X2I5_9BACT|nr:MAG: hypothetical protein C3F09_12165 [candidate division GN15 bacterium]
MTHRFRHSQFLGALYNLLLPGLAHFVWGDRLFGVFVFLIMILAATLAATSLLLPLPTLAVWVLLGLPVLFYIFSFVDLAKLIKRKRGKFDISVKAARIALGAGILYQLLAPTALVNFGIRNAPEFFVVGNNNLSPVVPAGQVVAANSISYYVNIPFIKHPIFHALPDRGDVVRYRVGHGQNRVGIVIGLPGETIAVDSGFIVVNGGPAGESLPRGLDAGNLPLTTVDDYSILVGDFDYGKIVGANQVSLTDLTGKVRRFY